jgi:hypothetical protein
MKDNMHSLGLKYGNDKVTHHRYDLIYPNYLLPFKNSKLKMLEIGLGTYTADTGFSRNMWKEYFPKSTVYVMDLNHEFEDELGRVIKGDQSNLDDLKKVSDICGPLDFIIDDGSHHPEHQLKTFDLLFTQNLKLGGLYIIEDIECSYWDPKAAIYGYETGHLNIIDFFSKLLHGINYEFSRTENKYNISQIIFGKNCIIVKKQTEEEIELDKRTYRFNALL